MKNNNQLTEGTEKYEIPVTMKLTPSQFLMLHEFRNRLSMDASEFLRMAFITIIDILGKKDFPPIPTETKEPEIKKQDLIPLKSQFTLLALRKYIISESLSLPTDQEIIKHWPDGAMSKNNVEFMIDALKKYIVASKRKIPNEGELINLWINGKKVAAPFCRWRELVGPEKLPDWLAEKFKGM